MRLPPLGKTILSSFSLFLLALGQSACLGGGATGGTNPMDGGSSFNRAVGESEIDEFQQEQVAPEDTTNFTYRNGNFEIQSVASQPMDPGFPDPQKVLQDKKYFVLIDSIQGVCKYSSVGKVKLEFKGTFWVAGDDSIYLRVVDLKDRQFLNTEVKGMETGNLHFTITTSALKPIRLYLMPNDFQPKYVNEERTCQNGACSPKNKQAVFGLNPYGVKVADIQAPECAHAYVTPEVVAE